MFDGAVLPFAYTNGYLENVCQRENPKIHPHLWNQCFRIFFAGASFLKLDLVDALRFRRVK